MIVTLDGRRLADDFTPVGDLHNLVEQVRAAHAARRLILSIALNGRAVPADDLPRVLEESVAGYEQVDLASGDPVDVAREALRALAQEFETLEVRLGQLADDLSAGRLTDAMGEIAAFVRVWQTCCEGLTQVGELLGRDLMQVEVDGQSVDAELAELATHLAAVRQALSDGDLIVLADIIRYEMPAVTQRWVALLNSLAASL